MDVLKATLDMFYIEQWVLYTLYLFHAFNL